MPNKYGALIMWGSLIRKGAIKYTPNLSKTRVSGQLNGLFYRCWEKEKKRKQEKVSNAGF